MSKSSAQSAWSFVDEDAVMAFVEHMVIEVCRATTPERPIQEAPFPRFTFDEACRLL